MDIKNLPLLKIHKLSKAQYERELAAGRIDENALYLTPDEEQDLSNYATKEYVETSVENLVNSAPEALNTLGKLATALENHEDAYDALLETVSNKAAHADLENLKEELSESIVIKGEEWKIVDSNGNIIFSVDANGARTTALSLNGEFIETLPLSDIDAICGAAIYHEDEVTV